MSPEGFWVTSRVEYVVVYNWCLVLFEFADEMKFSRKFDKVSLGQGQGAKAELGGGPLLQPAEAVL